MQYVWFEAFPLVFTNIYGFNLGMEGLAFLGIFSGVCVTYPFYCIYAKWYLEPLYEPDEQGNTRVTPEARLPPALIGCWAIPICLVCFWSSAIRGLNTDSPAVLVRLDFDREHPLDRPNHWVFLFQRRYILPFSECRKLPSESWCLASQNPMLTVTF